MKKIGKWLKGVKKFAIQQFRPASLMGGSLKFLDKSFENTKPYSLQKLEKMVEIIKPYVDVVELRK